MRSGEFDVSGVGGVMMRKQRVTARRVFVWGQRPWGPVAFVAAAQKEKERENRERERERERDGDRERAREKGRWQKKIPFPVDSPVVRCSSDGWTESVWSRRRGCTIVIAISARDSWRSHIIGQRVRNIIGCRRRVAGFVNKVPTRLEIFDRGKTKIMGTFESIRIYSDRNKRSATERATEMLSGRGRSLINYSAFRWRLYSFPFGLTFPPRSLILSDWPTRSLVTGLNKRHRVPPRFFSRPCWRSFWTFFPRFHIFFLYVLLFLFFRNWKGVFQDPR